MEIPQLTEAYYNARKNLTIFCGILIAYEWAGITFEGTLFEFVKIKSSESVPYVLMLLVVSFNYRYDVEWRHCDEKRRKLKQSIFDYYGNLILVLLTIASSIFRNFYD